MRFYFIVSFALSLLLTATTYAHDVHKPRHGGQLIQAGVYVVEWVPADSAFYLIDHGEAEIPTAGASGKVVAVSGSDKTTINVVPAGGNRLNLSEALPANAKAVVSVTLPERPPLQFQIGQ